MMSLKIVAPQPLIESPASEKWEKRHIFLGRDQQYTYWRKA
jgi:hypothetical protein